MKDLDRKSYSGYLWCRSPNANSNNGNNAWNVSYDGDMNNNNAYNNAYGVAPDFYYWKIVKRDACKTEVNYSRKELLYYTTTDVTYFISNCCCIQWFLILW